MGWVFAEFGTRGNNFPEVRYPGPIFSNGSVSKASFPEVLNPCPNFDRGSVPEAQIFARFGTRGQSFPTVRYPGRKFSRGAYPVSQVVPRFGARGPNFPEVRYPGPKFPRSGNWSPNFGKVRYAGSKLSQGSFLENSPQHFLTPESPIICQIRKKRFFVRTLFHVFTGRGVKKKKNITQLGGEWAKKKKIYFFKIENFGSKGSISKF